MSALVWRAMRAGDLDAVIGLADAIHRDHPERREVFAERLALFAEGARALERVPPRANRDALATCGTALSGYAIGHPWAGSEPKLDSLLGALPETPDHFYVHDVALATQARGAGAARAVVSWFEALARGHGFNEIRLVAVSGSANVWAKLGFAESGAPVSPSYGADARAMRLRLTSSRG